MDKERVSVLMLAHNHGPYIRQAAESVLAQQGGVSFRLWIGEDGSTDDTAEVCRALQAEHPDRVRVVSSSGPAAGMHGNFARLWEASAGPLVAFCEGDDYWCDPLKLAKQVRFFEDYPACTLCGTFTDIIRKTDADGWEPAGSIRPATERGLYTFRDLIASYTFHFSSVMVRREAVAFPPWFQSVYCVDRPLYLLAAQHGDAGLIPEVTSVYRLHPGGAWSTLDARRRARRSIHLFSVMGAWFPGAYRRLFRRTLGRILWSYASEAVLRRDYAGARPVYFRSLLCLSAGDVIKNLRSHLGVLLRLALYSCGWRRGGSGAAAPEGKGSRTADGER